jgi:hypothetical protein
MNLEQIIEEINKDIDDTVDSSDIIGWVNRCLDDLSPLTKKEDKKLADISPLNAYELPTDYAEMVLVLVNGIKFEPVSLSNPYSTGYKVWNKVLFLQNGPDSGQIELYYYRRLNHIAEETDIPEIEPSFHDLFVLYTVAHHQFAEEEPERQLDAMTRYMNRKREYQEFILQNSFIYNAQQQITDLWS